MSNDNQKFKLIAHANMYNEGAKIIKKTRKR